MIKRRSNVAQTLKAIVVAYHFSDPDKVLTEAYRVLKLHGAIYILDTTADNFIIRLLKRLAKKLERSHVKMYSTKEYQSLFKKAGLLYVTGKSIIWSMKIHAGEKFIVKPG